MKLTQRIKRLEDACEPYNGLRGLLSWNSAGKILNEQRGQITLMALPKKEGVPAREGRRTSDGPAEKGRQPAGTRAARS
jgi:hypothetical protein